MRILGIDPGTSLIGWGVIDSDGKTYRAIAYDALRTPPKIPSHQRVEPVYDALMALIKKHKPDLISVETLFFFKNAKTVMAVSEIRGVILLVAAKSHVPVSEHTPLQVKQAVSGYGKAEKHQVQTMVQLILGLNQPPRPDDVADALALAICGANTRRS